MTEFRDKYDISESECAASAKRFGQNLMFLLIGGGIGATLALLFAPKKGSELRSDIADMAGKRFDETLAAANQIKRRSTDYYEAAKQTGSEVFDVVAEGVSAVKKEVSTDVQHIGAIVENTARRAVSSAKHAVEN